MGTRLSALVGVPAYGRLRNYPETGFWETCVTKGNEWPSQLEAHVITKYFRFGPAECSSLFGKTAPPRPKIAGWLCRELGQE